MSERLAAFVQGGRQVPKTASPVPAYAWANMDMWWPVKWPRRLSLASPSSPSQPPACSGTTPSSGRRPALARKTLT